MINYYVIFFLMEYLLMEVSFTEKEREDFT